MTGSPMRPTLRSRGAAKAQTIITTLCAYICSPFQLAHDYERLMGDQPQGLTPQQARRFRAEKTELAAEAQVRGRILTEIHDRVRWGTVRWRAARHEHGPGPGEGHCRVVVAPEV